MKKLLKSVCKINRNSLRHAKRDQILLDQFEGVEGPIDTKHMLISLMLPPAVKMFIQEMEREVESLCGTRYEHGKTLHRWRKQKGSIVLGNQHVAIEKSRVRNPETCQEVDLESYENFQDPKLFEQAVFTEGLKKVSQRDDKKGAQKIASSFGFSKSSVSRRWINVTAKKIEEMLDKNL